MATIKFLLQSKSENAQIYLRLSINKDKSFKRKTGLIINPKDWSKSSSYPKQNNSTNKNIASDLRKLASYILDELNASNSNGEIIDSKWLFYKIELFFKRISKNNLSELAIDTIEHIINNSNTRDNGKGGIGLSKSRIQAYKRLKVLFSNFQKDKKYLIKELNLEVFTNFKVWLINSQKYGGPYTSKKLSDLKTVCKEARSRGIEVSPDLIDIKTKQTSSYEDDMDVITLTFDELDHIRKVKLPSEELENARKWLIIACFTGQRGETLVNRIFKENFVKTPRGFIIRLKQIKGNKSVNIPVLPPVLEIYNNGLPYKMSTQKLNKLFKEIGKLSNINTEILGIKQEQNYRGVKKTRPKYEYLSTHVGRRSFASNHYGKIPTPIIMAVTGHSKESTFLQYINKSDDSHIEAFFEYYSK